MDDVDLFPLGVLAALPAELGGLPERAEARGPIAGHEVHQVELAGRTVLATVGGVGKVAAASGAAALFQAGARSLVVVGTAGGLRRSLRPGTLVHCTTAFQVDLAVREHRQVEVDPSLASAWEGVVPGVRGWFLTADRPVLDPLRRWRLARAFDGPCVAEMETAAAGWVARHLDRPWAALRAVTDLAGMGSGRAFRENFRAQAGRAADTVEGLVQALVHGSGTRAESGRPPRR